MLATFLTVSAVLWSQPGFTAESCSYCARLDVITSQFKAVQPDPLDEKTSRHQSDLVNDALELSEDVVRSTKGRLSREDSERLVTLLVLASPYDNANMIGDAFSDPPLKNRRRELTEELERQRKAGQVDAKVAEAMINALLLAEAERKFGNEEKPDQSGEKKSPKPKK